MNIRTRQFNNSEEKTNYAAPYNITTTMALKYHQYYFFLRFLRKTVGYFIYIVGIIIRERGCFVCVCIFWV
jgi:hypothetical protein